MTALDVELRMAYRCSKAAARSDGIAWNSRLMSSMIGGPKKTDGIAAAAPQDGFPWRG